MTSLAKLERPLQKTFRTDQATWPFVLGVLTSNVSPGLIKEKIALINQLKDRSLALLSGGQSLDLNTLSRARTLASNTLCRAEDLGHWEQSNLLVNEFIENDTPINWQGITRLNSCLIGKTPGLRNSEVYAGDTQFLELNDLPEAMDYFSKQILATGSLVPALLYASRVYHWLISLHPFQDGNGRTARLVADWILLRNNLAPTCFYSPVSTFAAVLSKRDSASSDLAFKKVSQAVVNSYAVLLGVQVRELLQLYRTATY